jgi:hypothetical protein
MGTDCTGSCKSNYHTITTTAAPFQMGMFIVTIVTSIMQWSRQLLHDCSSEVLRDEPVQCESQRLLFNKQFFSYIMARTYCNLMRWCWCPFCTRSACWVWIFMVLAQRNNNLWIDMSPHSDTLSRFQANQSLFFLLNVASSVEKQQIPIF